MNSGQGSNSWCFGSDDTLCRLLGNPRVRLRILSRGPVLTRIQTLRRTDRGPGKSRRLFQRLGLLRPESLACVFRFGDADVVSKTTAEIDGDTTCSSSTRFQRLAIDGDQTLRTASIQHLNPALLTLDEPLEIFHSAHDPVVPIVVTDDVFPRQHIVQEGGYVMTFHQLWLLPTDVLQALRTASIQQKNIIWRIDQGLPNESIATDRY